VIVAQRQDHRIADAGVEPLGDAVLDVRGRAGNGHAVDDVVAYEVHRLLDAARPAGPAAHHLIDAREQLGIDRVRLADVRLLAEIFGHDVARGAARGRLVVRHGDVDELRQIDRVGGTPGLPRAL